MTLTLFALLSLATAQLTKTAIPVGQSLPVTTLSPASAFDATNSTRSSEVQKNVGTYAYYEASTGVNTGAHENEDFDSARDGDYEPYEVTEDATLVGQREGLAARAPAYRGTCKMNCKDSLEACQNACYYQNCIRGGGNVQYTEPGPNTADRTQAGVNVQYGTPCQTWPFGQKFWDRLYRGGPVVDLRLETDEWPMVSMQRNPFNPAATTPQVSLRCIPFRHNRKGGQQITNCRKGHGDWNTGRRFAGDRRGGTGPFTAGDWYNVEFFMGDFDMTNATERGWYNRLTYCHPQPNCANDGYQFHLTNLRTGAGASAGRIAQPGDPYDSARHNTYRLVGEQSDIQQVHIDLDITGQTNDEVYTRVYVVRNGVEVNIAERVRTPTAHGTTFMLPASNTLPKTMMIGRQATGCANFTFRWGNPGDGVRFFTFRSQNTGWYLYPRWGASNGRYCKTQRIPDPDPNRPNQFGTRLTCAFPAW